MVEEDVNWGIPSEKASGLDRKEDTEGGESWRESMEGASEKLQQVAQRTGEELSKQGQTFILRQKEDLALRVCGIGCAIRKASVKLREDDDKNLADLTESVASKFEDSADYIQRKTLREMIADADDYTRRHPLLILGGLFLGGLIAGRMLKASAPIPPRRPGEAAGSRIDQDLMVEPDDPVGMEMYGHEDINPYEEPRFQETTMADNRFQGREAEGFGGTGPSIDRVPESEKAVAGGAGDIGISVQSDTGIVEDRSQPPPPLQSFERRGTWDREDLRKGEGRNE